MCGHYLADGCQNCCGKHIVTNNNAGGQTHRQPANIQGMKGYLSGHISPRNPNIIKDHGTIFYTYCPVQDTFNASVANFLIVKIKGLLSKAGRCIETDSRCTIWHNGSPN